MPVNMENQSHEMRDEHLDGELDCTVFEYFRRKLHGFNVDEVCRDMRKTLKDIIEFKP